MRGYRASWRGNETPLYEAFIMIPDHACATGSFFIAIERREAFNSSDSAIDKCTRKHLTSLGSKSDFGPFLHEGASNLSSSFAHNETPCSAVACLMPYFKKVRACKLKDAAG